LVVRSLGSVCSRQSQSSEGSISRRIAAGALPPKKDRREARGARYQFEINKRWTIDGSPRWNAARYINHSCRPNTKPVGRKGRIVIVALRRIEPEEEITFDYGREYVKYFLENGGCRCAACRRKRALCRRRARRRRKWWIK